MNDDPNQAPILDMSGCIIISMLAVSVAVFFGILLASLLFKIL